MSGDATIVTGRRVADRYRLVDKRASGSWTAVDETLRRNVVIHVLPSDAGAEAKEHFTAEARALARLNHRNIVCTYDTGVDGDGTSYRVDELAGGAPLELGAVEDDRRVAYARQIAQAIADAHDAGLAVGDLSSSSVLVDESGRVQLRGLQLPSPAEREAAERADVAALVELLIGLAPPGPSPLRDLTVSWRRTPPTSARAMFDAIDAIADDAAVATAAVPVAPAPPPTGVPRPPRQAPVLIVAGVVLVVAIGVIVALVLPATKHATTFSTAVTPIRMTAKSFDPQGRDHTEDEADAHFVVDGSPATMWKTDRYNTAHFGNLKDGVGLILQSDSRNEFDNLTVMSPSRGWSFEVYVAAQPAATLAGWGRPIANTTVDAASKSVDLNQAQGQALLIWITDLGPANQVRISDVTISGKIPK